MIKMFIAAFMSLALVACGPIGGISSAGSTAATVNAAAKDTIHLTFETLDAVAQTSKMLVEIGFIRPGSQTALGIADGLDKTRNFLNAASAAQQAGEAGEYLRLIGEAKKAFNIVQGLISNGAPS
jgi:hypothetical protein